MRKTVLVISGPTLSGKSWLISKLVQREEFRDAVVVRMDDIGVQNWGRRPLTETEALYRNELVRNEVKYRIILGHLNTVIVEAPLLTRACHQAPFVATIEQAERLLQAIEREHDKRTVPSTIALRVVFLYCDQVTAAVRLQQRQQSQDVSNSDILSLDQYRTMIARYEIPDSYKPLPIDTSMSAGLSEDQIINRVVAYAGGLALDPESLARGLAAAHTYFNTCSPSKGE